MEVFRKIMQGLAYLPDWLVFLLPVVILAAAAGLFTYFGGRKGYPVTAIATCSFFFAVLCAKGEVALGCAFVGILIAVSALLALLFLLPSRRKKQGNKQTREQKMFDKFYQPLETVPLEVESPRPPKVCCYQEESVSQATQLSYVKTLVEKLRTQKLSAGDRLELDVLTRSLDGFRGKELSSQDMSLFNDCLATVLRFIAKYQL